MGAARISQKFVWASQINPVKSRTDRLQPWARPVATSVFKWVRVKKGMSESECANNSKVVDNRVRKGEKG